jgi:hypothetical protein
VVDASESRATLLRLRGDLLRDTAIAAELADEVEARAQDLPAASPEVRAYLAVLVHRFYTSVESAIERVERTLGSVPEGPEWHHDLLRGATYELEGVRPAILGDETYRRLSEILRFRHFFRHAYAVELDENKLGVVVGHLVASHGSVDDELRRFADFLRDLAESLAD